MDGRHALAYALMLVMVGAILLLFVIDRRKRAERRRIMKGRKRYPKK